MSAARERPIRLLALDIDGTLIDDDLHLRPRTRAAVRASIDAGVGVVLATGRIATSALPYARDLGLTLPLIAMQGALVREMPAPRSRTLGRLVSHEPLAAQVALDVIAWCRAAGMVPHVNHLERMIVQADDPWADDFGRYEFGHLELVPSLEAWIRRPVTKVIGVAEAPLPTRSLPAARAAFAGRADATVSHPLFLEFVAPGVSKGAALRRLARREGIDMRDVLAAGDQLNDLEMVSAAGWGVAMAHAPEELRSAARIVAREPDDGGLARVIEELVLGRPAAS